jgi:hypothetical protein
VITFRRLPQWPIPTAAVWLLTDIAEAKGRAQLYARQSPQVLKALREMALIQSTESSNRIEGVTVERQRLRPLVLGGARPRDRSEQEVQGQHLARLRVSSIMTFRSASRFCTSRIRMSTIRSMSPS